MTAKLLLVKSENGLETRQDYDGLSSANPAFTGTLTGGSAALTGGVDAGGEIKSDALVGAGTRPLVALADGTIDDQDAAVFLGTIGALASTNPEFTGALKRGGTPRITSGGGAWFASMQSTNLVGAGDRPVAADLTGTLQPKTPDQFRSIISALASSLKGAANGVAELGADVKVPVAQLPSAALLALGADSTTAHRGDHGTTAYTHSQLTTGNPHGTTAADVGALASANPNFTGNLLQDGDQRITPSGGGRFTDLSLTTLAAGSNLPVVSDAAGVIRNKTAGEFRTIIGAAASAGVTDGSDAASGVVGQYYEVFLPEASFVYAVNGSPVAVLSLSLPAGDWLVEGRATAHITGAMNGNKVVSGLNTSIAIPTDGTEVYGGLQVFSATNGFQTMTGSKRFSLTATTTVYLVARIDFSAGTPALFGCMSARRMR